jgi:ubiquinone/menaquinone biosynthesis C-methylase UbiE
MAKDLSSMEKYYSRIAREALARGRIRSLGSGNPLKFAGLKPGEVVVDLGSGMGVDCLLASRMVGRKGEARSHKRKGREVIGIDISPQMIVVARKMAKKMGVDNVKFLRAAIEDLPLPSSFADVVISNCVINLSSMKAKALQEAYRILKNGGRLIISDIALASESVSKGPNACSNCVSGALTKSAYLRLLKNTGFKSIKVLEEKSHCCKAGDLTNSMSITIYAQKVE